MSRLLTGGCQCGAVRFCARGVSEAPSICHCRMCQKAFGAFYAPLVNMRGAEFEWTRGEPRRWRSSNHVLRGFCSNCGTPLTYEAQDGLSIAIGAFDEPSLLKPVIAYGCEAKLDWADEMSLLPEHNTMDDISEAPFLADIVSYQHPDHDTLNWVASPPETPGRIGGKTGTGNAERDE